MSKYTLRILPLLFLILCVKTFATEEIDDKFFCEKMGEKGIQLYYACEMSKILCKIEEQTKLIEDIKNQKAVIDKIKLESAIFGMYILIDEMHLTLSKCAKKVDDDIVRMNAFFDYEKNNPNDKEIILEKLK